MKRGITKFECDKSKYQWDSAAKEYGNQSGKEVEDLTDKDKELI